jgi:type III pantothenate kinase
MADPLCHSPIPLAWLGLVVGNTRLHWAQFTTTGCHITWHTPHLTTEQAQILSAHHFAAPAWAMVSDAFSAIADHYLPWRPDQPPPLVVASVVPSQTALWLTYPAFHEVQLAHLPLARTYPTLGIDRALNLLGARDRYGWPVLVIDAGTALTFTAGTQGGFNGGAILPGWGLQRQVLSQYTASLPAVPWADHLPSPWSTATEAAIQSGIQYGLLFTLQGFIADWHHQYPITQVVFTGGDGDRLFQWFTTHSFTELSPQQVHLDPALATMGLGCYCCQRLQWLQKPD